MNKRIIICIVNHQPADTRWYDDDDCFYYYKWSFSTLDWGSKRSSYILIAWNGRIILLGKTHRMTISWWKVINWVLFPSERASPALPWPQEAQVPRRLTLPDYFIAANAHPHTATIYAVWRILRTYHGKVMTNRPTHQHSCIDEEPSRIAQNENPPWWRYYRNIISDFSICMSWLIHTCAT